MYVCMYVCLFFVCLFVFSIFVPIVCFLHVLVTVFLEPREGLGPKQTVGIWTLRDTADEGSYRTPT